MTAYRTLSNTTEKGDDARKKNVGQVERIGSTLLGGILLAMGAKHLNRCSGWSVAAIGGGLLYRGMTGKCELYRALNMDTRAVEVEGIHIHASVTINRSAGELYHFWRDLENLPQIMSHLESVRVLNDTYSHWVAKAPAGKTVAWDAEVVSETENHEILWRSREGSQITNAGSVRFVSAGERGTEVHVSLSYIPPAGAIGATVAKMFGEEPNRQIKEDLLHFKQFMETGEVATTQGQVAGHSARRKMKAVAISSARSRTNGKNGDEHDGNGHGREREEAGLGIGTFSQEGERG